MKTINIHPPPVTLDSSVDMVTVKYYFMCPKTPRFDPSAILQACVEARLRFTREHLNDTEKALEKVQWSDAPKCFWTHFDLSCLKNE